MQSPFILKLLELMYSCFRVLVFLTFISLNACHNASVESVKFNTPEILRNIPESELSVTVVIDDQPNPYQGVLRNDGLWVVYINVELNRVHTANVAWFALDQGNKILVARQTSTFFAAESGEAQLNDPLQTDGTAEFDIDCDGSSNLTELTLGTDPSSPQGCNPVPSNDPDDPSDPDDSNESVDPNQPVDSGDPLVPGDIPIPETIAVEPGCFDMGSPLTEPDREEWETPHNICIEKRLHVGIYEITFDQYFYFASQPENPQSEPYDDGLGSGSRPVRNITWEEATSYTEWLSKVTGDNYRLLTEAEWEYVARAGTTTAYWTGDIISSSFENIISDRVIEVGSLNKPNPWGFHDMLGNVSEWTCTSFKANYDGVSENTCDPSPLVNKALRGGTFYSSASSSRSAKRFNTNPTIIDGGIGFRVVRID